MLTLILSYAFTRSRELQPDIPLLSFAAEFEAPTVERLMVYLSPAFAHRLPTGLNYLLSMRVACRHLLAGKESSDISLTHIGLRTTPRSYFTLVARHCAPRRTMAFHLS